MPRAGTQRPILKPPKDEVIDDLVCMAVARTREQSDKEQIRELVLLLIAELQEQIDEAWTRRNCKVL